MKSGLFFCTCLFLILVLPLFAFSRQPERPEIGTVPTFPTAEATEPASYAFYIPDAPIAVWELGDYEGEFLEGNSDEPVRCACIVLENTADKMLEYARIRLAEMTFEVTCLPARAKVLVLEKNKLDFAHQDKSLALCEEYVYAKASAQDAVFVSTGGERDIIVTNLTEETLSCVAIRYKQYSPEAGLYWGGITYSIEIKDLQPAQSLSVSPYRFLTHRSKLIDVKTKNEKPES